MNPIKLGEFLTVGGSWLGDNSEDGGKLSRWMVGRLWLGGDERGADDRLMKGYESGLSGAKRCYLADVVRTASPSGEVAAGLGLPEEGVTGRKLVVGRREWVRLPGLGVGVMNAKTDSGARTSSLHAEEIKLSADQKVVSFTTQDHDGVRTRCEVPVGGVSRVKSSTGEAQERVWIEVELEMPGGFRWMGRLTLADRGGMLCPMLLGRRCLAGYFVVDVQGNHLAGGLKGFV
ncbi:MAG: ATP-dependent zinc protease [Verrucomicrobiales bacterium]